MVVTHSEADRTLEILQDNDGRHSNKVLYELMREFGCGPVRAGNLIKHLVKNGKAHEKGLKFHVGPRRTP